MQQSKHWKTQQSTTLQLETQPQPNNLQTTNPTPIQQSTNWKPNLNPTIYKLEMLTPMN
jgi:hypothetical protein